MRRLITIVALGSLLLTAAVGCGPSKGSTTPSEVLPVIPGGPDASGGGKGGKAKDANAPPGSGVAH